MNTPRNGRGTRPTHEKRTSEAGASVGLDGFLHVISKEMLLYALEHIVEEPVFNPVGGLENWQVNAIREYASTEHQRGTMMAEAERIGVNYKTMHLYVWRYRNGKQPAYWSSIAA